MAINPVSLVPKNTGRTLSRAVVREIDRANFAAQAKGALNSCRNSYEKQETLGMLAMRAISDGVLGKFKP